MIEFEISFEKNSSLSTFLGVSFGGVFIKGGGFFTKAGSSKGAGVVNCQCKSVRYTLCVAMSGVVFFGWRFDIWFVQLESGHSGVMS